MYNLSQDDTAKRIKGIREKMDWYKTKAMKELAVEKLAINGRWFNDRTLNIKASLIIFKSARPMGASLWRAKIFITSLLAYLLNFRAGLA